MLRRLYAELTRSRDGHRDALTVILAGRAGPVRGLLRASPPLAARFPAVIGFPPYTPGQLAAIFAALAGEVGFTLTPAARRKAAIVLARAEAGSGSGNARLAVRLLDEAAASQARRITAVPGSRDRAALCTISAVDIPPDVRLGEPPADDGRPGQYRAARRPHRSPSCGLARPPHTTAAQGTCRHRQVPCHDPG